MPDRYLHIMFSRTLSKNKISYNYVPFCLNDKVHFNSIQLIILFLM